MDCLVLVRTVAEISGIASNLMEGIGDEERTRGKVAAVHNRAAYRYSSAGSSAGD